MEVFKDNDIVSHPKEKTHRNILLKRVFYVRFRTEMTKTNVKNILQSHIFSFNKTLKELEQRTVYHYHYSRKFSDRVSATPSIETKELTIVSL